jgi:NAD(P)-dependent dehydrogenase (short-subunit alcohol dehydrogenase family)
MPENERQTHESRDVVVVTGASSGIGRATASALSARGFKVLAGYAAPRTPGSFAGQHESSR